MKTNVLVVDDLKSSRLTLGGILEDDLILSCIQI